MPAPAPMQFAPLQFAQAGPGLGAQLQALGKNVGPIAGALNGAMAAPGAIAPGSAVPGAAGPTAAGGPNGPQPLVTPGTVPAGPPVPGATPGMAGAPPAQPGILDALKGMQPQQILDVLRNMSAGGQKVIPPGMPGAAALQGAGMIPSIQMGG